MKLFVFLLLMASINVWANDPKDQSFKGDEEAGAVIVTGNVSAETYNLKSDNAYTINDNTFGAIFNYVQTRTFTDSAVFWDGLLRYERSLSHLLSVFIDEKWESDSRAGYTQRVSSDIGARFYIRKDGDNTVFAELGYRYSDLLQTFAHSYSNNVRAYAEWQKSIDNKISFKLWAEYIENLNDHAAYLFNQEESLSVMLTDLLSLKFAYLTRYQAVVLPGLYNTDVTTTAALVAKF